jgi:POT family proton-dependent oligopeptide transporter
MSTQVGRLYPPNDARRDGAYTIFYMGINLGAFLSPLVCGALAASPSFGFHYGFAAAGVGMLLGLAIYLFGLPMVKEIDQDSPAAGARPHPGPPPLDSTSEAVVGKRQEDMMGRPDMVEPPTSAVLTEAECEKIPSAVPFVNSVMVMVLYGAGALIAVAAPVLFLLKIRTMFDMVFFELIAICAFTSAWILGSVHNAVRDRVLAIYALFAFVVVFWGGFEQAGNVHNIWADQSTNRYLWTDASPPPLREGEPEKAAEGWFAGTFNPVPTAWFQSINALAIFLLAPLFAWMWVFLDRRGINPSIPFKMGLGVLLLAASFALMIGAAKSEDQQTKLAFAQLPALMPLDAEKHLCQLTKDGKAGEPFFAGRLEYDAGSLILHGALPIVERDRILAQTAPKSFVEAIEQWKKDSASAGDGKWVELKLKEIPPGFDWSYTGFAQKPPAAAETKPAEDKEAVKYDPATGTLKTKRELADKDLLILKVAASAPAFRDALNQLVVESSKFRVTSWWLFWAYMLATLGELCLSPVGLSMVSKLAPAKYATMLMGLWLLTSTFGQFLGGELGERYGEWTPTYYFVVFCVGTLIASILLFVVVRWIGKMMHGVK